MSDDTMIKEITRAAQVRALGARLTSRAVLEQAVDVIDALTIALQANTIGYGGALAEVEAFKQRLLAVAEEQEP